MLYTNRPRPLGHSARRILMLFLSLFLSLCGLCFSFYRRGVQTGVLMYRIAAARRAVAKFYARARLSSGARFTAARALSGPVNFPHIFRPRFISEDGIF